MSSEQHKKKEEEQGDPAFMETMAWFKEQHRKTEEDYDRANREAEARYKEAVARGDVELRANADGKSATLYIYGQPSGSIRAVYPDDPDWGK